ncbi:MAG: amino acid permease [Bacteroidales bacterium]|jgi:amino acid transporter|nr:amino acid permease [Bacteroidales bacterium]
MKDINISGGKVGLSTIPVYFTAISSILGAILFLRFGYATGVLGFWGVLTIILLGHLITIPTALAISELATNTRVEGGGEYFIISRSFGLKIGSTIGITLFLSQTISIAFYTIAFAESFQPLFKMWFDCYGFELPRQIVSIPTLLVLSYVMLRKGTGSSIKLLYIFNIILLLSLLFFFFGNSSSAEGHSIESISNNFGFFNREQFFIIFAICFPAFTGMTAGVGLSGDLKNPSKSIPIGTMAGTLTGLIVYIFVVWKFSISVSQADLLEDQLIMSKIAFLGFIVVPIGLAASTSSSAIGSMMVAPRTLQAIANDSIFPFKKLNVFFSRGKGEKQEPFNASLVSFAIALIFVALGDVDTVAEIISMFFLITYGTLCLSSFLNHFGSPPSYRPRFKSRWYISLAGFLLSVWIMFMINPLYTFFAYLIIILIYLFIEHTNKDKKGMVNIFKGALFQLNRRIQVYMQKHQSNMEKEEWRPATICISPHSMERGKLLDLMKWISYQHGFGTYFHFIEGYYSKQTHIESKKILEELINTQRDKGSTLYIDTMISPSYTSAIAQVIQTPSISGMENNMVIFEYDKRHPQELNRILENLNLVRAGNFDVGIFAGSEYFNRNRNGIHVWIRETDEKNTNFMILLGYIIMAHPDWKNAQIKIFITSIHEEKAELKEDLRKRIAAGRLPITLQNIEIIILREDQTFSSVVEEHSKYAGLTLIGFREEIVRYDPMKFFTDFDGIGDILFVNSFQAKEIL